MAKDKKKKNSKTQQPVPSKGGVPPQMSYTPQPKTIGKTKVRKQTTTTTLTTQPNISSLSPDQLQQLQLEEAIKESQNPSMRLKKLKSPLSVKSCFWNLILFIVLTIVIVLVVSWFMVDRFNVITIMKDILNEFGIIKFFDDLFKRIGNLFTGKGWTLEMFIR